MALKKYLLLLIFFPLASNVPQNSQKRNELDNSPDTSPLAKNEDHFLDEFLFQSSISPVDDFSSRMNKESDIHPQFKARSLEPEATMDINEIIQYHGYPLESYEVTTEDGYILRIQRIPYGLAGPGGNQSRKPVLLQHGLFTSAACWVTNTKSQNFPYILADAGYDVWLGNIRGTEYGRRHLTLSPKNIKFWAYSFDEIAKYDIPAVIDTMLNVTGFKHILYIGHSMGTIVGFALMATQPKYNEIIKGMMAMAPAAYLGNVRSPIKYFQQFTTQLDFLFKLFGKGEFLPNNQLIKSIASSVCTSNLQILCSSVLFGLMGFNADQLNMTRLPVIIHHTPAATSTQNFIHILQLIKTGKFQYHDFGTTENMKRYGQLKAPLYKLSKVTAPVALFWSDNDLLTVPSDVARQAKDLPNLVYKYRVPMSKFTHTDFMWAIDGKTLLYDKVISIMRKLWN